MATWREAIGPAGEGGPSRRRSLDEPPTDEMRRLPHDLAARVFAMLPPASRARCAAVSRGWRELLRALPPAEVWGAVDFTVRDGSREVRGFAREGVAKKRRSAADARPRPLSPLPRAHPSLAPSPPPPPKPRFPSQATRDAVDAAVAMSRGALRSLKVPGDAGVSRASFVALVRSNRESLRELHASASSDGARGHWTPKQVHALVSAAGPRFRKLVVDVKSRGVCGALVAQLASPVVRVRRLEVRATALTPEEKSTLFDALRRLRAEGEEPRARADDADERLTRLTLASCGLSAADAAALAEALAAEDARGASPPPLRLDLGDNPALGDEGIAALAALVASGKVRSLGVRGCGVGAAGAAAIGAALASPTAALTRLDASKNFLGAEGAVALADGMRTGMRTGAAPVRELRIAHNAIGCEGAEALARAAAARIPSASIPCDEGVGASRGVSRGAFANLALLDAGYNGVGPAGTAALAEALLAPNASASALRELRLEGNPLGAAGARALSRHAAGGDGDGADGDAAASASAASASAAAAALETLALGSTRLGVVGAAAVAWAISRPGGRLSRVASLDLSANEIGEGGRAGLLVTGGEVVDGAAAADDADAVGGVASPPSALASLARDLAASPSLRALNLGYNSLGDAGAGAVAAALASAGRTRAAAAAGPVELDLQRNSIGDAGAAALAAALGTNLASADADARRSSSGGYEPAARRAVATRVDLRSNAIGAAGMEALASRVASGEVLANYMPAGWAARATDARGGDEEGRGEGGREDARVDAEPPAVVVAG